MKLGDAVHSVLHPLAERIDPVLGTDFSNCGGCEGRRQFLNKIDLFRGRGKVESMFYDVTINTQKIYRVEATSSEEALTKTNPQNETFTGTTNNVRISQNQGAPPVPAVTSVPA